MGDRLSKSSVLSDSKVIELLNKEFLTIELNVTDVEWPPWMEGVAPWAQVFRAMPRARFAFANIAVVDWTGKVLLASGDDGLLPVDASKYFSMNYDPPRFLKMLEKALDRSRRLEAARTDPALSAEARAKAVAAVGGEAHEDLKTLYPRTGNQFRAAGLPSPHLPPVPEEKRK